MDKRSVWLKMSENRSPSSSNDDLTPPPLQIPPEITKYHENGSNNNIHHEFIHTPSFNAKKSFCIESLLAKNQNSMDISSNEEYIVSDLENKKLNIDIDSKTRRFTSNMMLNSPEDRDSR